MLLALRPCPTFSSAACCTRQAFLVLTPSRWAPSCSLHFGHLSCLTYSLIILLVGGLGGLGLCAFAGFATSRPHSCMTSALSITCHPRGPGTVGLSFVTLPASAPCGGFTFHCAFGRWHTSDSHRLGSPTGFLHACFCVPTFSVFDTAMQRRFLRSGPGVSFSYVLGYINKTLNGATIIIVFKCVW